MDSLPPEQAVDTIVQTPTQDAFHELPTNDNQEHQVDPQFFEVPMKSVSDPLSPTASSPDEHSSIVESHPHHAHTVRHLHREQEALGQSTKRFKQEASREILRDNNPLGRSPTLLGGGLGHLGGSFMSMFGGFDRDLSDSLPLPGEVSMSSTPKQKANPARQAPYSQEQHDQFSSSDINSPSLAEQHTQIPQKSFARSKLASEIDHSEPVSQFTQTSSMAHSSIEENSGDDKPPVKRILRRFVKKTVTPHSQQVVHDGSQHEAQSVLRHVAPMKNPVEELLPISTPINIVEVSENQPNAPHESHDEARPRHFFNFGKFMRDSLQSWWDFFVRELPIIERVIRVSLGFMCLYFLVMLAVTRSWKDVARTQPAHRILPSQFRTSTLGVQGPEQRLVFTPRDKRNARMQAICQHTASQAIAADDSDFTEPTLLY